MQVRVLDVAGCPGCTTTVLGRSGPLAAPPTTPPTPAPTAAPTGPPTMAPVTAPVAAPAAAPSSAASARPGTAIRAAKETTNKAFRIANLLDIHSRRNARDGTGVPPAGDQAPDVSLRLDRPNHRRPAQRFAGDGRFELARCWIAHQQPARRDAEVGSVQLQPPPLHEGPDAGEGH